MANYRCCRVTATPPEVRDWAVKEFGERGWDAMLAAVRHFEIPHDLWDRAVRLWGEAHAADQLADLLSAKLCEVFGVHSEEEARQAEQEYQKFEQEAYQEFVEWRQTEQAHQEFEQLERRVARLEEALRIAVKVQADASEKSA